MSPGSLDSDVVERHLTALDLAVTQLRKHTGRPVTLLLTDTDELWIVERGLQLAAQNALDLATHIAASSGSDVPDYASAIDVLGRLGVLDPSFVSRFRAVAGLRNRLVHGYLEVDRARLHGLLNDRLDDFVEFAARVRAHVSAQRGS